MILTQNERGEVLRSQLLAEIPSIDHYASCRSCQAPAEGVWLPRQVHGTDIVLLDDTLRDRCLQEQDLVVEADAVVTRLAGQWIGVRTADCVPVLLADPVQGVVAAVHAGWRGTVRHIARLTVAMMTETMGCRPSDIRAAIGPSISPEAFEVGEEVAAAFAEAGRGSCVLREIWGERGRQPLRKPHVDLWQSNVMDLLEAGLELDHIDCSPCCTMAHVDHFYSARSEGIGTGRIVSAIKLQC